MNKIEIKYEDFINFKSGWSLHPVEAYIALKYTMFEKKLNILEFGSGDGTKCLAQLLNNKKIEFNYKSLEHDTKYCNLKEVDYVVYNLNDINHITINDNIIYDLIIVDGPHGSIRKIWYEKIKNSVRNGTIILVDDYHHYSEFEEELSKNYLYDTITIYNQDKRWQIINEGVELYDSLKYSFCEKTFKIVKITEIK